MQWESSNGGSDLADDDDDDDDAAETWLVPRLKYAHDLMRYAHDLMRALTDFAVGRPARGQVTVEQEMVSADVVLDLCHFHFLELEIRSITQLMNVTQTPSKLDCPIRCSTHTFLALPLLRIHSTRARLISFARLTAALQLVRHERRWGAPVRRVLLPHHPHRRAHDTAGRHGDV